LFSHIQSGIFCRPCGTWDFWGFNPALKCRAIVIASLRDFPFPASERICTLAEFGYIAVVKRNFLLKFSAQILLALAIVFIVGCKTTPPVDWNARVGTYTFDQAVTDYGPPDRQAKLTDGQTVAKWITHRSGGTGFGVGTGLFSGGGGVGIGVGQSVGNSDKILTLTFGTNNVLSAWSKNY
jgi:hypothetical protein